MTLYDSSVAIIKAGQASSGAYVASPTFSQYGYSWLRDGAWIAYGMDCAGEHASARAFYTWAGRTLIAHRDRVERVLDKLQRDITPEDTDYLPTRFTLEGEIGTDDWWDFQLDGYGTWLWGLVAHVEMTNDHALWESVKPAVELTVRYLTPLWQSSTYDCWEEHREHIHPSTLAALFSGLSAVHRRDPALVPAHLPESIRAFTLQTSIAPDGHFMKYLGNTAVDASLLWLAVPYGLVSVDDARFQRTLALIEQDLLRPGGGVYRYAADVYYGGGEWVLLTAWLGWVYVELGRTTEARKLLGWTAAQATADGALPEQVSEHLLHPEYYTEWENRWGTVACPLLWSHAMYLILASSLKDQI
ncbi:MAG: glycoside hydrolase family 15 protein [Chloroflexi bacterium]|nr:glycoside hydrolase family 15 protein [Chloroflexota bacterium]